MIVGASVIMLSQTRSSLVALHSIDSFLIEQQHKNPPATRQVYPPSLRCGDSEWWNAYRGLVQCPNRAKTLIRALSCKTDRSESGGAALLPKIHNVVAAGCDMSGLGHGMCCMSYLTIWKSMRKVQIMHRV